MEAEGRKPSGLHARLQNEPDGLRRAASIRNPKHDTGRLAPCHFNTVYRIGQDP
jgi:hypothetical protein